jgi:glyoxylase-like metal-dependent hydrolase (beta-lactamase superfamily II)
MRDLARLPLRWRRLAALFVVGAFTATAVATEPHHSFGVDTLGDGVHLYRPADESSDAVNSLVVERNDGVLVVAAQPSPEAARKLLAAIDARLSKPVRYLVFPHSHADTVGGASAFPESVLVIGSLACRDALADADYDFGAEARARSADPAGWGEPPRRLPVLLLEARSTLDDERNPVELLPFGSSHSPGDLLVRVPGHDVFFLGGLIFPDGRPYAGDSQISSWMSALNHFVRQAPRVMVPLRGPVIGVAELREQRNALAWLRGQVEYGLSERWAHEEIRERILAMPEIEGRFATDSPFLAPFIDRAVQQAVADRIKLAGG